jgi:hypothetical protein
MIVDEAVMAGNSAAASSRELHNAEKIHCADSQAGQHVAGPLHALVQLAQHAALGRLLADPRLQQRQVVEHLRRRV